jgi:hypothetical protein
MFVKGYQHGLGDGRIVATVIEVTPDEMEILRIGVAGIRMQDIPSGHETEVGTLYRDLVIETERNRILNDPTHPRRASLIASMQQAGGW